MMESNFVSAISFVFGIVVISCLFYATLFIIIGVITTIVVKCRHRSTECKNKKDKSRVTEENGVTKVDKEKFCRMIVKLENDERNSDVKIVSNDGKEFHAYRWILSETSEVFESMFRSNTMENESGLVQFEDLSGATVKLLLHFIYTREIGMEWSSPGIVDQLTYAADKYQIEDLKKFLDTNLVKICTAENAIELLALAEKTSMSKAVVDILAFIIREKCKDQQGLFEIVNKSKVA